MIDWFRCSTISLGASFARGLLGLKRAHLTSPAKTVPADLLTMSTQDSISTLALWNMEWGGWGGVWVSKILGGENANQSDLFNLEVLVMVVVASQYALLEAQVRVTDQPCQRGGLLL